MNLLNYTLKETVSAVDMMLEESRKRKLSAKERFVLSRTVKRKESAVYRGILKEANDDEAAKGRWTRAHQRIARKLIAQGHKIPAEAMTPDWNPSIRRSLVNTMGEEAADTALKHYPIRKDNEISGQFDPATKKVHYNHTMTDAEAKAGMYGRFPARASVMAHELVHSGDVHMARAHKWAKRMNEEFPENVKAMAAGKPVKMSSQRRQRFNRMQRVVLRSNLRGEFKAAAHAMPPGVPKEYHDKVMHASIDPYVSEHHHALTDKTPLAGKHDIKFGRKLSAELHGRVASAFAALKDNWRTAHLKLSAVARGILQESLTKQ